MNNRPLQNRTALITGASSGIGRALAFEYARAGANLVLVARRLNRLDQLSKELTEKHAIEAVALVADLSDSAAPEDMVRQLTEREIDVDILINNAGYGVPGKYLSVDWQVHRDFEQVMTIAVMHLTYLLLPQMLDRGWGRVVNIASLAGHVPGSAGHTCYEAVKAWMVRFSESLHFEYASKGVITTAVCPGFTYSEFHDVTGTREQVNKMHKRLWMTAAEVARQTLQASESGKVVHITGGWNRLIARAVRWAPTGLLYRVMKKQSSKFRKTD
nr:uncharacterized oxidoreductase YoxD-like [Nerophis lumbriciformis]